MKVFHLRGCALAVRCGVLIFALGAAASIGAAQTAFKTQVRFANWAAQPRHEWGLATVPFPAGVWTAGKTFGVAGSPNELTPLGARWPDGSVRFAQLAVRLDMPAQSERIVTVSERRANPGTFTLSPWVQSALARFDLKIAIALAGSRVRTADLRLNRVAFDSPVRKVLAFRARVPDTDFVYDLWLTFFADQDSVPFELRVTNSRNGSQKWKQPVESIGLYVNGAPVLLRGRVRRGVDYVLQSATGVNYLQLHGKDDFYDGQGIEFFGDLLMHDPRLPSDKRARSLLAVLEHPLYGVSMDWAKSGAYGPFGHLPSSPPPWITDGGRSYAAIRRASFTRYANRPGKPWEDMPLGLRPHAGSTGDQHDYGAGKLLWIFASGFPDGIEEVRFNGSEEAYRPVHHREADGSPVRLANHSKWVAWGGRSHFSKVISPDRLGKPFPEPYFEAHGWTAKDHEHWISLTLAGAYLLTGSWSLRHELDNEAELYMAGHTIDSRKPKWATNDLSASRAVAWTFLSMSWNYLCTGRDDLRQHMRARADENVKNRMVGYKVRGPVKPVYVAGPDQRTIPKHDQWKPWEESLAVMGLEACHQVTGSIEARRAAATAARNLMLHGWKLRPNEATIATAVGWLKDGQRLSQAQYGQREWVLWSYGTGFNQWAWPAVKLSLRYARDYQDKELDRVAQFVKPFVLSTRRKPRDGGWDRLSEWDCVK